MSLVSIARKACWLIRGEIQDIGPQAADLTEATQERLGVYCLDFRPALRSGHFVAFDDGGVPLKVFPDGSRHYNPTRTAGYAIACFQEFGATGDDSWRERFLKQADWFVTNAGPHEGGGCVWRYGFSHGDLPAGWISAMAQGQAMSVLSRALLLTEDSNYLKTASEALPVFNLPVDGGGVVSCFPGGGVVYEETPLAKPSRILNGWIYALWGLKDLSIVAGSAEAEMCYQKSLSSLTENIGRYDIGWWSTYDLPEGCPPRLASFHYHLADTWLLAAMCEATGQTVFGEMARRWQGYAENRFCRLRALVGKIGQHLRYGY